MIDEFVAEFDKDEQIESADGYHLTELNTDVESDIALLWELRDLAQVVIEGAEPKQAPHAMGGGSVGRRPRFRGICADAAREKNSGAVSRWTQRPPAMTTFVHHAPRGVTP